MCIKYPMNVNILYYSQINLTICFGSPLNFYSLCGVKAVNLLDSLGRIRFLNLLLISPNFSLKAFCLKSKTVSCILSFHFTLNFWIRKVN